MADEPLPGSSNAFSIIPFTHRDMAQAVAFNPYGDRFATGSVDGKIKVYDRLKDGTWSLCDTWGAHSAEVLQLQWLPSTIHPNLIGSIGLEGRFKLWVEDPTIAPRQGRRFHNQGNKVVWEQRSPPRSPYLSFCIKHNRNTRHTYLVLIQRNAEMTLYCNEDPEMLNSWTLLQSLFVCEKPNRGEETSFKVMFDPNIEPCFNALRQGVQRDSLAVVVASMDKVTVWRTKDVTNPSTFNQGTTKEFYFATELKGHKGLVRDVAWAQGNVRGYDTIATACKDGRIRIFKLMTPPKGGQQQELRSKDYREIPPQAVVSAQKVSETGGAKNPPSGIGAGLAGAKTGVGARMEGEVGLGEVLHVAEEVCKLEGIKAPVWKVDFDADGQLLGSTGDDGKLSLWRREPSGIWSLSAELALEKPEWPVQQATE